MTKEISISHSKFIAFEDLWVRKPNPFPQERYGQAFYEFFDLKSFETQFPEIRQLQLAGYLEVKNWALTHLSSGT